MKRSVLALLLCVLLLAGCSKQETFNFFPTSSEEETYYMNGVWVATAANIDFPSKSGLSAEKLRAEADEIVSNCEKKGITAIFLQVRPYSDALYTSRLFPASAVLSGEQGRDPGIDVLSYFTQAAHRSGIELHAWINPYRITTGTHDLSTLAKSNPAVLHPEYTVRNFDANGNAAGLWYNPGLPEVRQLICDGVAEIAENYDVDGIHLDDYFYPYDSGTFDDSTAYGKYGQGMSLGDFRRSSVTALITELRQRVGDIAFGVSPCGVWAQKSAETPQGTEGLGATVQAYYDVFADVRLWIQTGLLDYVCPQLYWHSENTAAPFRLLADWWCELCEKNNTRLYIGLAAYKGSQAAWAGEIVRQNEYLEYKTVCDGVIYFSYGSIKNDAAW